MELDGVTPPKVLTEQPKLPLSLLMYLEAFHDLDTERNHGMSLARIPWSAIVQYAEHYGYDVDETLYFVRKMDDAHLEKLASHQSTPNGRPSGTSEVVRRPPRPD